MIDIASSIDYASLEAIVFDLDGTLYQKPHMVRRMIWGELPHLCKLVAERRTRKRLAGNRFVSEEVFYDIFFRKMAAGRCFSEEAARQWYDNHYMPLMVEVIRKHYHAAPWALEVIRRAKEKGVKVAVFSDYGCVSQKLGALQIDESVFDLIISGPELGGLKPAKACMEEVIRRLGTTPERTLMIGDRDDTDGESARRVGAQFICCK